ncbi:Mitochondrial pyruvate carrier 4 [Dichanthelium oligosanthes]|uniref:Mitochondrial pyruvate carrier n=1 Tax=Dichanthelium oligosanthes TaxID=888268 RepID=A0A1E5WBL8_9POAL|nr:Mitochondrial pyruvate carrier 4 [Dichanthelium oligosanthes]
MASSKFQAFWNHPAGPETIHFWAPTFKWCLNVANVADFVKPPEEISYPQQLALGTSGLIWARYSMVITPVNKAIMLTSILYAQRLLFLTEFYKCCSVLHNIGRGLSISHMPCKCNTREQ